MCHPGIYFIHVTIGEKGNSQSFNNTWRKLLCSLVKFYTVVQVGTNVGACVKEFIPSRPNKVT